MKKAAAGTMILLAAWAVCCLGIPTALWGPYMRDARRYLFFNPNGEMLSVLAPLALLYVAALILVVVISKKFIRARSFRAVLLTLAALAGIAGILVALSGATLLVLFPFGFAIICGAAYVAYAERFLVRGTGKDDAL